MKLIVSVCIQMSLAEERVQQTHLCSLDSTFRKAVPFVGWSAGFEGKSLGEMPVTAVLQVQNPLRASSNALKQFNKINLSASGKSSCQFGWAYGQREWAYRNLSFQGFYLSCCIWHRLQSDGTWQQQLDKLIIHFTCKIHVLGL